MPKKTCFVISPINEPGSEIRAEADALLWAVEMAVGKYGFSVVRIDEISQTMIITQKIVQYIRESELCVIVLSGNNPNVFYEAGRRHETGLPFIHLLREGEAPPFDVAGITYIRYREIETRNGTKDLVESLEKFVETMQEELKEQKEKRDQEVTLSAIARGIDDLGKKIDRLSAHGIHQRASAPVLDDPMSGFLNPREAFMLSVASGDVAKAAALLPKLHDLIGDGREYLHALLMTIQGGERESVKKAMQFLNERRDWMTSKDVIEIVGTLVSFYSMTDREKEGIEVLAPIIDSHLPQVASDKERASLLNQRQRLLYGAGEYEEALKTAEQVIALVQDEPAYFFNASLIYEKLGDLRNAEKMIDKALEFGEADQAHLRQAVEVYLARGNEDKALTAWRRLKQEFPERAALELLKEDVRRLDRLAR
ncbi:MAG: tetratricopeptide repeat protein [Magnetococcales bacterium]|nr:tetratricopeptide repeat protein [Magnetococcales bacterium]